MIILKSVQKNKISLMLFLKKYLSIDYLNYLEEYFQDQELYCHSTLEIAEISQAKELLSFLYLFLFSYFGILETAFCK